MQQLAQPLQTDAVRGPRLLALTLHAATRAQQRGISRDTIHLVCLLADRRIRVPGGAHALSISDTARGRWVAIGGLPPADLERTRGIVVIADIVAGSIITCEHTTRRRHVRR